MKNGAKSTSHWIIVTYGLSVGDIVGIFVLLILLGNGG